MSDPIQSISALLNEISSQADVEESAEWYLRSYLVDYKRTLLRKWSSQEVEFATGALMRFCGQSLDKNGALYRVISDIAEEGTKLGPGGHPNSSTCHSIQHTLQLESRN